MAFQHIRSGDLANIIIRDFADNETILPVKVRHIGSYGEGQIPWADVTATADRNSVRRGDGLTIPATDLISRTPSKGVSIPVWRKEN